MIALYYNLVNETYRKRCGATEPQSHLFSTGRLLRPFGFDRGLFMGWLKRFQSDNKYLVFTLLYLASVYLMWTGPPSALP